MAKRSIKRNSRAVALLACIALAVALLPAAAFAVGGTGGGPTAGKPLAAVQAAPDGATRGASGECGKDGANLTWALDDEGKLTISGTGKMADYSGTGSWGNGITAVEIGDGVESIGKKAFEECDILASVDIPVSVTSIGEMAFYDCDRLASVTGMGGVETIGDGAFSYCEELTSIAIPASVATIGVYAFGYCTELARVEIPASVTSVGDGAFADCPSLADVYYHGSPAQWDGIKSAFSSDPKVHYMCGDDLEWTLSDDGTLTISGKGEMANYKYLEDDSSDPPPWYDARESITTVVIGDGVTTIGEYAFQNCSSLEGVEVPVGVETIGKGAFAHCVKLASVTIPEGVTSIEPEVFWCCTGLESVTIPDGVTGIGSDAFNYCTSLESAEIPDGVTSIGAQAFRTCTKLASVVIPSSVKTIGESAFDACSSLAHVYYCGTAAQWAGDVEKGSGWISNTPLDKKFHFLYKVASEVSPEGVGRVSVSADPDAPASPVEGSYWSGTTVTVEVEPETGYRLERLTYDYEGGEEADIIEAKSFDMPDADVTVTATFKEKTKLTITAASDTKEYDGTELTNGGYELTGGALAEGDTIKSVQVEGSQTTVGTSDNVASKAIIVNAGKDVTANYDITYVNGTLEVTKAPLTITAKDQEYVYNGKQQGEGDPAYDNPDVIATKVKADGLQGNDAITSIELNGSHTDAGVYEGLDGIAPSAARIGEDGTLTGNYAITYVNGKLAIEPAPLTVTTGSASKVYDGTPLTKAGASISGLVNGETATVTATGSRTEVGSSPNTCSIEWDTADPKNYAVTERLGTLTVETAPARKGTLTFDLAGGTLDGKTGTITIEADVGDTIKLPGAPRKSGYAFKFWKGSEYAAGAEYKVEGDHAFTAEWVAVHTVSFDANGHGKAPDTQTVEHGKKAKRPANPTADGYTFGGWYTDKACKEAYDFSAPVTEDVTLYAKWTKKSSSGSGTSPKTGDPLAGAFAVALALAAASALALAASRRRRRD